jgi:hypothetical protein
MNSIHNNGENNQSLNDGLDKLSLQYQELGHEQPPELLDQAILNSAHREVEKKRPHWMKFGWLHGLTTAAVFVLAFTVILDQRESAPVYDQEIQNNGPARLQRERVAKKQLPAAGTEAPVSGLKEKDDYRQNVSESRTISAPSTSAALDTVSADQPEQAVFELQRSVDVQESLHDSALRVDEDTFSSKLLKEELSEEEVELNHEIAGPETASGMVQPTTVAEPGAIESKLQTDKKTDVEKILMGILKLKQNGDESWETELRQFKETYPDYPLPEELNN